MVTDSEVVDVLDQLISDYHKEDIEDGFSQTDILAKTLSKALAVQNGRCVR